MNLENYSIDLYKEKNTYCACIGTENSSGCDIEANSIEELAKEVADYFKSEIIDADWDEIENEDDDEEDNDDDDDDE